MNEEDKYGGKLHPEHLLFEYPWIERVGYGLVEDAHVEKVECEDVIESIKRLGTISSEISLNNNVLDAKSQQITCYDSHLLYTRVGYQWSAAGVGDKGSHAHDEISGWMHVYIDSFGWLAIALQKSFTCSPVGLA
jgi:hypothetical protein